MRLGAIPENLIEHIIGRLNVAPEPLIETQMAMGMARIIMAATKYNVFEALKDGPATAETVASACATHPGATTKLLNTLVSCRYVTEAGGRYDLTPKTRKWMLKDSPNSLYYKILFQYVEWTMTEHYEDFLATGKAMDIHHSDADAQWWETYQRGMRSLGGISAPEVAKAAPIPAGATALLDIGGSHGFYSVCFCRKHPSLKATILDLPEAVRYAALILAEENMGDRVVHQAGNALTDDLGENKWDAVFASQLIHHFTAEQNADFTKRIARALKPGGVCMFLDSIRPETPAGAGQIAALLDFYFAALSESGTWPLHEIQGWQRDAGLQVLQPISLRTLPGGALVVAKKA